MSTLRRFLSQYRLWVIAGLAFLLYFALAAAKPASIFWSLDEGGKWVYLESTLRSGDPSAPLIYPGRGLDPKLRNVDLFYYGKKGTEIRSWWPVNFPLMALPFYRLLGWSGLYLLPALAGAAVVYLTGKLTQVLSQSAAAGMASAVVTALATPVAFYSTMFWEHTLSVMFFMAAACLLLGALETTAWKPFFWAGICASLAIWLRSETAFLLVGFGIVLLFRNWRRAVFFAGGTILAFLVWGPLNYWLMGSLFSPNVSGVSQASAFQALTQTGWRYVPYILFNTPLVGAFALGKGWLAAGTLLAGLGTILGLLPRARAFSALPLAGTGVVCAYVLAQPALYRSVHGVVLIAPFILCAAWLYGTKAWERGKVFWWMALAGMALFAGVYVLRGWQAAGGLQWGSRYLLALYPLLTAAAVCGLWESFAHAGRWQARLAVLCFALLVLTGFGFQIRGYATMLATMRLYQQSGEALRRLDNEIILSDCSWISMVIPDLYWQGNVFRGRPKAEWSARVTQAGRGSYLYVHMASCNADPLEQAIQAYRENPDGLVIERVPAQ